MCQGTKNGSPAISSKHVLYEWKSCLYISLSVTCPGSFTRCAPSLGKSTFSPDMKHPFLCDEIWRGPSWIVHRVAARVHAGRKTWASQAGPVPSNIRKSTPTGHHDNVQKSTKKIFRMTFFKKCIVAKHAENTRSVPTLCLFCFSWSCLDPSLESNKSS